MNTFCRQRSQIWRAGFLVCALAIEALAAEAVPSVEVLRAAVEKSLPLLTAGARVSMEKRERCFTCHNQGLPIMALTTARSRGIKVDEEELRKQVQFTADFLERNRTNYLAGKGQGGQADTAGYALWALANGGWKPDATTAAAAEYLLQWQKGTAHWSPQSRRPPTEQSLFTSTHVALRGLKTFGTAAQRGRIDERFAQVRAWLLKTKPEDTEDRVSRLRALRVADGKEEDIKAAAKQLLDTQRADGGWAQMAGLESDAYATATALVALHQAGGLATTEEAYLKGLRFLLAQQLGDGSWRVTSRSKPIQTYYESGYPHGTNQFISISAAGWATTALTLALPAVREVEKPFHTSELIFPLEHWHNHGSCIVEAPNGDLIVCWFHGSGERQADDVKVEGARLRKGAREWSARFTMADTPDYPDTNCCMFVDPRGRLWLMWPTILANQWESALMKYRIASDYAADGPPKWEISEVMHVTPGPEFDAAVTNYVKSAKVNLDKLAAMASLRLQGEGKLTRRLGWFTRAHPFVLDGKRLIVPLYSDGFSFSLMNISDDWGATWKTSAPLIGGGNIQPSLVKRKDGSLYALMRDNGPPPKRLHQAESRDRGETWSAVTESALANPGSGAEIISLRDGRWILISNDLEEGRYRLCVQLSDDEGKSWKWRRILELAGDKSVRFHYPSLIQAKDGTLHASYSIHFEKNYKKDAEDRPLAKAIKHAHFNVEWLIAGDPPATRAAR